MINHSLRINHLLFKPTNQITTPKRNTQAIPEAVMDEKEKIKRTSPAQVRQDIMMSAASVTCSILPMETEAAESALWRYVKSAVSSRDRKPKALCPDSFRTAKPHTPPHCHPHVTQVPLKRTVACIKRCPV